MLRVRYSNTARSQHERCALQYAYNAEPNTRRCAPTVDSTGLYAAFVLVFAGVSIGGSGCAVALRLAKLLDTRLRLALRNTVMLLTGAWE
jgi:hypothetical protein